MKTLFILRHAKSSWENYYQSDFERPLNERGVLAAPLMGKLMRDKKMLPDLIVSSPAARAKQTAEIVKKTAHLEAEIKFDQRIYEATVGNLLGVASETPGEIESLLLVGHNPGLENLVESLTDEICAMPTAALAKIRLRIENWREISPASGRLMTVFKPKEISNQS